MAYKNFKEESRKDWGNEFAEGKNLTIEQLNIGCMLRIADATEAMTKNHVQMQYDIDWYKKRVANLEERLKHLDHSNRALRGTITRMKKSKVNN